MKKPLLSFLCTLATALIPLSSASALSVAVCEEDTIGCRVQNCESRNSLAEWDAMNTGLKPNFKDCNGYEKQLKSHENEKYLYASAGAFAGISAVITMLLVPRTVKKHLKNNK